MNKPAQIRSSSQIRNDFLNFFQARKHTIVASSSLMPDSPNLLFTNAGMNQFVPIFLGQAECPYVPGRAADTQKCIRAGGKHNDLDDVGLDTYHHTFFEMLGNWSFGDYFKKEAIDWAWELVVKLWGFPANRVYATVFCPYLGQPGWEKKWQLELEQVLALAMTSSDFIPPNPKASPFEIADQEAAMFWAKKFSASGLDPKIHIVPGNKKDNFWMMGETGPCGPCSELHIDLTPRGDTRGQLVNKGSPACIEIWNLVFIQFNANPDGSYVPLPAKHVDTGMGFERVTSILQGTKNFTDFTNAKISNYETDIFRPLFDALEQLSGKKYGSTLPGTDGGAPAEQVALDIAFRVISDHIRTLSFAIADGIQPSNEGRGYVLRRILRRAVRYGRSLGFHEPFFYKLVDVLAETMGDVFPEIRERKQQVQDAIRNEEEAFNRTLDRGIEMFNEAAAAGNITGAVAFKLYDEQGFPLDLTELMARERGLTVDKEGFETLMEEQRNRARAAQKKTIITVEDDAEIGAPTNFVGYDATGADSKVLNVLPQANLWGVVLSESPFYAAMGGQVADTGVLSAGNASWRVVDTKKVRSTWVHVIEGAEPPKKDAAVHAEVDLGRRNAIQRHHTVTHLLHWALHEVASKDASQKGSFVGPDKLTFDFNSQPLTPQQVADIEKLVNERIVENAPVSWTEVPYPDVKSRKDVMQFFGDKYGDVVRVVQIGGTARALNGYSMELCGGTHTRATGEIGLFRIVGENAIAAGVRRIEAVAGLEAYNRANQDLHLIKTVAGRVNAPVHELDKKIEALMAHQKELEKQLKAAQQREASNVASNLLEQIQTINGIPAIVHNVGGVDGDFLQAIADSLKGRFKGVIVLGGAAGGSVALIAAVSAEFTSKIQAGKIIQQIAPIVGGKGGGRPDNARGGGKDAGKLDEALATAKSLLG
ncbi:MAG TPA: alanine--tRNA ligase [Desulfuromonadaceae bacterium]|nr:alanine--tRNA ligase [Desulfuromonadaceae bacterium]